MPGPISHSLKLGERFETIEAVKEKDEGTRIWNRSEFLLAIVHERQDKWAIG